MPENAEAPKGKRRPQPEDLPGVLETIGEGKSLREACTKYGLHPGHTHAMLKADTDLWAQYAGARELRADHLQEEGLTVAKAAALGLLVNGKKVDAAGARVYLESIKWATARMAPKDAPVQRIDLTSRTRQMTDAEIAAEIAALEASTRGQG